MELFDKIRLSLAKKGKLKLEDWADKYGDDEEFVEACIESRGVQEFEHASYWLRSDAEFILKMVTIHPEILKYCEEVIYDRYIGEDYFLEEVEVDPLFFVAQCCEANINSFKYVSEDLAKQYFDTVKQGGQLEGMFHGKNQNIKLSNDKDLCDVLLYVRYDLVKCVMLK